MFAKDSYPKILIFSQTFNNFSGGGITLTNLFSGWPKDRIAVISYDFMLVGVSTNICGTYYQLGDKEIHWKFPFSMIKQKPKSGLLNIEKHADFLVSNGRLKRKQKLPSSFLSQLLRWLGLDHSLSHIYLSDTLSAWLLEYKPELLYFQISNRESVHFSQTLIDYLGIPSVIHMMDDWPSVIADRSISSKYWKNKIYKELKQLMNKIDLHLSICDEMAAEYKMRYGHEFHSFHNTLDLAKWTLYERKDIHLNDGPKILLFSGRIGRGIGQSLIEVAAAVKELTMEGLEIRLHIQSPRSDRGIINQLRKFECVKVNPPIEYDRLPQLYSTADILVIANDFTTNAVRFLKYSMPTKVPEYMISGTPIIVYASSETALYKFFKRNNCGHCVERQNITQIADGLRLLLQDHRYSDKLSRNAIAYANKHFDSVKVRQDFHGLLIESSIKFGSRNKLLTAVNDFERS